MAEPSREMVTGLLKAWNQGDDTALSELIPIVYRELHWLAHQQMARERRGHTLQSTALINEVYLRLLDCARVSWTDRTHFLAVCAQLMRRILVDHARTKRRLKRGGVRDPVTLDEVVLISAEPEVDLVALDQSLERLAHLDERKAKVVELLFFGGLTMEEAAQALGVSRGTVKRDWRLARAWIYRELNP